MKHILLVHNIGSTSEELQTVLLRAGFAVTVVRAVGEALSCLRSKPADYDLVCCRLMLPYHDGFELLESVRDDPAIFHVPFVLLAPPANEWETYKAWRLRRPRYEVMLGSRLNICTVENERPPFSNLLHQDILEAISAALQQHS
jgi:CheY-like chemotaxis protein